MVVFVLRTILKLYWPWLQKIWSPFNMLVLQYPLFSYSIHYTYISLNMLKLQHCKLPNKLGFTNCEQNYSRREYILGKTQQFLLSFLFGKFIEDPVPNIIQLWSAFLIKKNNILGQKLFFLSDIRNKNKCLTYLALTLKLPRVRSEFKTKFNFILLSKL